MIKFTFAIYPTPYYSTMTTKRREATEEEDVTEVPPVSKPVAKTKAI